MVDNGLEVTNEVGEFGTKGGVESYPDGFYDDASNKYICEGDALADEEGTRREVGLEGVEGTRLALNETGV